VGNCFIAAVEFGPSGRAKALTTGGESGDPASPHFSDQAQMYCAGRFRDVWFSTPDVMAHAQRRYHPGES
jgi:acyl-homoserine-lactone acylase